MRLKPAQPPRLWTLLLSNLAILALPLTGLWALRLYESALVRQTQAEAKPICVFEGENGMSSEGAPKPMSSSEKRDVEELSAPRARIIYEVVRKQGEEELDRPPGSLFWSGLAGGITIMMSVVAEGALHSKLPANMPLRQVISDLGYSLGFLMVILGRMQLFTEQTIVTVLPNMAEPTWKKLGMTARLWAIVFAANMIGTCAAAAIIVYLHLTSHDLTVGMLEVSSALIQKAPMDVLLQAVPAGFLMASVAWIRAGVTESDSGWS